MNPAFLGSFIKKSSGGGGSNNIVFVQGGGATSDGIHSVAFTYSSNVTNGNTLLVGVVHAGSNHTFSTADLSKTGGTASIGSVSLDQSIAATASIPGTAIFRVQVTGTGTLQLSYDVGSGALDLLITCSEFSGVTLSFPLGVSGNNSGTGTVHSTGVVSLAGNCVVFYVAGEASDADFTRTWSDQVVFHKDTGATTMTGIGQYLIEDTSPITMTDTTGSDSVAWNVTYAQYISV